MNTFFYRYKRKFCSKTYCEEMYSKLTNIVLFSFPFQRDKFNDVFEMFVTAISDTIEKHAPLSRLSRKQARLAKKPWITKGIFTSLKRKNTMFRSHFISGNVNEKRFFRKYTNILPKQALSKKIYFRSEINKNNSNARKTWDIIRSVLPNKLNREPPSSLKINNVISGEPSVIANEFNDFFCTIGPTLAGKIKDITNCSAEHFFDKPLSDPIFLEPPKFTEVFDEIMSLKDKAVGHDNISAFFLTAARHEITPFIKILIDFVFREGIFPDRCKITRIAPIHKNAAKDETNNYRPISILTCFSKIVEKLIYRRLIHFFQKHHILYPNQFGFQSKTSTAHAMLDVVTSLYDSINRNQ